MERKIHEMFVYTVHAVCCVAFEKHPKLIYKKCENQEKTN